MGYLRRRDAEDRKESRAKTFKAIEVNKALREAKTCEERDMYCEAALFLNWMGTGWFY